jgi:hypothetical protein
MSRRNTILAIIGVVLLGFIAAQFVHLFVDNFQRSNPPVVTQVAWDSPETEEIVRMACYDCHSNESEWPWYAYIAPASWLVARDVNEGRAGLNFSEPLGEIDGERVADMIWHIENDMPPPLYIVLHPEADLSDEQRAQLIAGIEATFGPAGDMGDMDMDE